MKRIVALFLAIAMSLTLCACSHKHKFEEATCTEPKTCSKCGATDGEPLGHDWEEATCTKSKTCSRCGATEGEALGHIWIDATCTEAKTCSICGATDGEPLGHSCEKWTVVKKATCTEKGSETGVCTVCGETAFIDTEYAEHTPGDWEVKEKATVSASGMKVKKCTVCGKELESEYYQLDPFDISPIKKRSTFVYDDFNRSWKYYSVYDNKYSDATEIIGIILFSEDNGTNIEEIEIRAFLNWKDAAETPWNVKSLEFLIDGSIYHFDMTLMDSENISYAFLYNETSYQFVQSLANTSKIKIKITYDNEVASTLDLSSNPFRTICKDIIDYSMWDYYIPSDYLAVLDTTTVR